MGYSRVRCPLGPRGVDGPVSDGRRSDNLRVGVRVSKGPDSTPTLTLGRRDLGRKGRSSRGWSGCSETSEGRGRDYGYKRPRGPRRVRDQGMGCYREVEVSDRLSEKFQVEFTGGNSSEGTKEGEVG